MKIQRETISGVRIAHITGSAALDNLCGDIGRFNGAVGLNDGVFKYSLNGRSVTRDQLKSIMAQFTKLGA